MASQRSERPDKELPTYELPAATLRLFDGYDPAALAAPAARDFVIGRLLEEGDRADLAWLAASAASAGSTALADWLARRANRQLSRRSRRFWRRVLAPAPVGAADGAAQLREALWPL
jgi:hypothetical protein